MLGVHFVPTADGHLCDFEFVHACQIYLDTLGNQEVFLY